MPRYWRALWAGLALGATDVGVAQDVLRRDYWKTEFVPYVYATTSRGLFAGGRFHVYAPVPYDWSEANAVDAGLTALVSTAGAYTLRADLHAPAWATGWRLRIGAGLERDPHLAYYGIGNATRTEASRTASDTFDVRRRVAFIEAIVQRQIVGPLRILAGVGVRRSTFDPVAGQTVFANDLAAGILDQADRHQTVEFVRAGLVFDTRDHEVAPTRGIFAETLVSGDGTFTRVTGHVRGYLPLGTRLRVAARLAGERIGGSVPFGERYFLETSEGRVGTLGGYSSHRGLSHGRFVDAGKFLASADLRYHVLAFPSIAELIVFGFVDAGRVFRPSAFSLTTDALHWGGGGGLALRIGRNVLLAFSVAGGPDGVRMHGGSGWSY